MSDLDRKKSEALLGYERATRHPAGGVLRL